MKPFALLCLLLLSVSFPFYARGQVAGCATGDISWSGGGVSTCLPGTTPPPEQNPDARQPPSPAWESRWGAIATDEPHGALGMAANQRSKRAAEREALNDCAAKGGKNCVMQASFANACGALIVGDKTFNVAWGATLAIATKQGMDGCTPADTNCHVYKSICSPAVRTQ